MCLPPMPLPQSAETTDAHAQSTTIERTGYPPWYFYGDDDDEEEEEYEDDGDAYYGNESPSF